MTASPLVLVLPLPVSPNARKSHLMAAVQQKNGYRAQCWIQALQQAMPRRDVDLPEHVRICACFYVRNLRDEDNLAASLKWVLDCLKQEQPEIPHWRHGLYDQKGYFLNDDPLHCTVDKPEQRIDRKDPRLVLAIYSNEQEQAA